MPAGGYLRRQKVYRASLEDEETYEMILKKQAEDENEVGADGKLVNPEKAVTVEEPPKMAQVPPEMSIEKLRDFDYLLSNFYTVDSATMIGPDQLNADDLLSRSMKMHRKFLFSIRIRRKLSSIPWREIQTQRSSGWGSFSQSG